MDRPHPPLISYAASHTDEDGRRAHGQPSSFSGAAGLETLLNTAYASFLTMQACYDKSFALIGALDAAVRNSATLSGQAPPLSQSPAPRTAHISLALNSDDPAVNDFMAQRTDALRAMQDG